MLPCAAAIELYLHEIDASGGGVDAVVEGAGVPCATGL